MGNRKFSIKRQIKLTRELRDKFNQSASIELAAVSFDLKTGLEDGFKFKVFWKIDEECQFGTFKSWEELEAKVEELLK
jgi:hypothetical protein